MEIATLYPGEVWRYPDSKHLRIDAVNGDEVTYTLFGIHGDVKKAGKLADLIDDLEFEDAQLA